jgi:hypothetical protein
MKNHCGIFRTADTVLIHAANGKEVKPLTALDFSRLDGDASRRLR